MRLFNIISSMKFPVRFHSNAIFPRKAHHVLFRPRIRFAHCFSDHAVNAPQLKLPAKRPTTGSKHIFCPCFARAPVCIHHIIPSIAAQVALPELEPSAEQ
jgi:hypothetical protein